MGGTTSHIAVTKLYTQNILYSDKKYFLRCKKLNTRPRFSHSSQSTDTCRPLSEVTEEYKLPGVAMLRFHWELCTNLPL
jgi:hypothetical protein